MNNIKIDCKHEPPGCTNPPNPGEDTAYVDIAASVTILGKKAKCKVAEVQEPNIALGTPAKVPIHTTETLELLLKKLPAKARRAFRVNETPHNLIAVAELVDAGCSVHLYGWGCEIDLNGETLYRGWREGPGSRLFRLKLTDNGTPRIQPDDNPADYDAGTGTVCMAIGWSVNSIYECQNKNQLTLYYYHASLSSHPKQTLAAAAKAGYLRGFPGLSAEAINKYVGIETATEMGHMRQLPSGTRSTTKKSNRGRPALDILERDAAAEDALAIPEQEPNNTRTKKVFMTVKLADGWIASEQTGAFPRVSNKGNKYIALF